MTVTAGPNTSAEVTIVCFDGEHKLALKLKQIDELQRVCGAGLGVIVRRVTTGEFYSRDISETVRLALIGGGMPDVRALEIINTYVDGKALMLPRPPLPGEETGRDPSSPYNVARAVLDAAFFGMPELAKLAPDTGPAKKKTEATAKST